MCTDVQRAERWNVKNIDENKNLAYSDSAENLWENSPKIIYYSVTSQIYNYPYDASESPGKHVDT